MDTPESSMMTLISKSNHPSSMRCPPRPLGTPVLFLLFLVPSALKKVRNNESTMRADTLPHTPQLHQATVTHPMDMVPSPATHPTAMVPSPATPLLRRSMSAVVETLPLLSLGKPRTGRGSPSVRTEYPVLGIIPGQRPRPEGGVSMICPPRITLIGSILIPSSSTMLHNRCRYTLDGCHQKFLGLIYSRAQAHQSSFTPPRRGRLLLF